METFSALLAICTGNSPVSSEFLTQRPVTQSFDVCFDLRLNERLSKQSRGWWFEAQSHPLWRHSNVIGSRSYLFGYTSHYLIIIRQTYLKALNTWNVRYILSSMFLRLSQYFQLSFMQYVGLCVFRLPISPLMVWRIFALHLIITMES